LGELISRCPLRTIKANVIEPARRRLLMPLLLVRLDFWKNERRRREPHDHESQGEPAQHDPADPQRHLVVGRRRMTRARQKQQNDHQAIADLFVEDHVGNGQSQKQDGHAMGAAADQRIKNMTAIQLTNRHQVKRGDKDPDPAGKQPGVVAAYDIARWNRAFDPITQPLKDQRGVVAQLSRIVGFDADVMQPDDRDRNRQHQTRQRPTDGDIEQALPVGDPRPLNDHGSHRAKR